MWYGKKYSHIFYLLIGLPFIYFYMWSKPTKKIFPLLDKIELLLPELHHQQGRPKLQAAQALALGLAKNRFFLTFTRPPNNSRFSIYRPRVKLYHNSFVAQLACVSVWLAKRSQAWITHGVNLFNFCYFFLFLTVLEANFFLWTNVLRLSFLEASFFLFDLTVINMILSFFFYNKTLFYPIV
jgi:hypothetical protein